MTFILKPGQLTLKDIEHLLDESTTLTLDKSCTSAIHQSQKIIENILKEKKIIYGINTGFGALAQKKIEPKQLEQLQTHLVLSHAAGTGPFLSDQAVRLILLLKINSLARGFSGIRIDIILILIKLFNAKIYPLIPAQGSVGASGDLAPLAHLSALLLGVGKARYKNKIISAKTALKIVGLHPIKFAPKEGLALLNGTQVSTALAILAYLAIENIFKTAMIAGALSIDAACGSIQPFDERIHIVRGHPTQIEVAKRFRELLRGSHILKSHRNCQKVQDPYSLRCQPQVMGACLAQMNYAKNILITEANAVSDNPLIFAKDNEILSGGNFHAEPIAFAADTLAIAIAEIGAMSERRIAVLIDPQFTQLPAFLVENPGMHSGFMLAQVTAAALVSENKSLAHPASVDSLPTSLNQEDHVSMATYAARRLLSMAENATTIVGIELLAACQGIDFRRPLKTSNILEKVHQVIRKHISFYAHDRFFAPDIENIKSLVQSKAISCRIML